MAPSCSSICILLVLVNVALADFPYKEDVYVQYIDHYNLVSYGDQTFKQRYLYQDKYWGGDGYPIFFYSGNEGPVDTYWKNSGFIHEIAPEFKAFVVFTEHRFFGSSLPFGNKSFTMPYLGMLSAAQAVADYTMFLNDLKTYLNASNSKIIAFGGSYGGVLAAYMRYKHPSLVHGALAASAPVLMQAPEGPHDFFFPKVTKDFRDYSEKCYTAVKLAFAQQLDYARLGQPGLDQMVKKMRLCSPIQHDFEFRKMQMWARNAFVYLAMLDYPYPTEFLGKLPANPVNVGCDTILKQADPLVGLADAVGIWYNATGSEKCYNVSKEFVPCSDPTGCGTGDAATAWDFLSCTDIYLPHGSNNKTDMFPELPWDSDARIEYCQDKFHIRPRIGWNAEEFFGLDLTGASNIIFSNGDLDPWFGGGVTKSVSDTVVALIVQGGAHHLDLRASNKLDPPGVVKVREQERNIIRKWLNQ
ncbi:dipeptidyl peptidase 2 [Plakobranchus ocellatus]|uniref:Dipeptidyl peptidase 2 n=1 Tax=Plakobranchus ocellatus TaxID=259542 RepID=A0AAV4AN42_9GAST|nr:dipeptidyl peptidase 2 [Plakobranchus ocellatus]